MQPSLKIDGTGSSSGGYYDKVIINGNGNIKGDLVCSTFKTNGVSEVLGNMETKKLTINGTCEVNGKVSAEILSVNGHLDIEGSVISKDVKVDGYLEIDGSLNTDIIKTRGVLKVKGDCNAEQFNSQGMFNIDGLLNAGDVNVEIVGKAYAKEIGAENVKVKIKPTMAKLKKFIHKFLSFIEINDGLTVDVIEGDIIELENTKAKIVRGSIINIGKDCIIDRVEYKDSFTKDDKATVSESVKL
ncbi:MAG: hypothetical protein K0S34_1078 [Bacillales bacterium]|jgi:cytoskeletal protein CcmA (bactofilin family)|nr:hypothetical protein [Bacillales bacterium]